MKNEKRSIDGLVPRSPGNRIGHFHREAAPKYVKSSVNRTVHTGRDVAKTSQHIGRERPARSIHVASEYAYKEDIFESLDGLDEPAKPTKSKAGKFSRNKDIKAGSGGKSKKRPSAKKIIKWLFILILVAVLAVGGFLVYKAVTAGSGIFSGNIIDVLTKNEPLKEDENGRSNFLIFGTAEDSEGGNHGGANLTDSIMVLSISQTKKDAYMLSLPRDMWVKYEEMCTVGYQGKLNATYFCASNDGEDEKAGAEALRKKAGEITGLDIQYHIHLNFTAVTDAVDAVGGVDVTIESTDPRGILDRNFDWRCNYQCYMVNYKNGENVHLDGEHALALARARNAAGGYGVNDNFGREKNQQMILKALREKALSAGTLTNLGKVTGLIDALGNNLRTNVDAKEVRTLMSLASEIDNGNIISLTLYDEDNMLVTTGSYSGQSIVRPVAGLLDYSEIIDYVNKSVSSEPFVKEAPQVVVLNGSGVSGAAGLESDRLSDEGFTVNEIGNTPESNYTDTVVYQISADKPASAAKLELYYGVKVKVGAPPVSVVGTTDFVVILGKDKAKAE